jgi:hypothetical protein
MVGYRRRRPTEGNQPHSLRHSLGRCAREGAIHGGLKGRDLVGSGQEPAREAPYSTRAALIVAGWSWLILGKRKHGKVGQKEREWWVGESRDLVQLITHARNSWARAVDGPKQLT